jgi:hypothetical protein
MKIIKIANQFADEGKDSLESPEREQFEAQQELKQEQKDREEGRKGTTHTADVLNQAMKSLGNPINSSYVVGGSVGWIKHSDGIIYEILVQPLSLGGYYNYYRELQKEK